MAIDDAADAFPFGLEEQRHVVFTNPLLGLREDQSIVSLRLALDYQLGQTSY